MALRCNLRLLKSFISNAINHNVRHSIQKLPPYVFCEAPKLNNNSLSCAKVSTSSVCFQDKVQTGNDQKSNSNIIDSGSVKDELGKVDSEPQLLSRNLRFPTNHTYPRVAWLDSMDSLQSRKLGMIDLHPDVFATYPRIDLIAKNLEWQTLYKRIDYDFTKNRAELPGSGRKIRPQKKTGMSRQKSRASPIWIKGAKPSGPRGPTSHFYMLPTSERGEGLRVALSCKFAQNDIVFVDNFNLPTSDKEWLAELVDVRFWGDSVLFVDDTDTMPENLAVAQSQIRGFTAMPAYGLNVYSIVKHETLVMTLSALERVENKLLDEMHSCLSNEPYVDERRPEDFKTSPDEDYTMYQKYTHPYHNPAFD